MKARRILGEGRVVIEHLNRHEVTATVRGDGHRYVVTWRPSTGWTCPCEARGRCSHLLAVGLVVAVDIEEER